MAFTLRVQVMLCAMVAGCGAPTLPRSDAGAPDDASVDAADDSSTNDASIDAADDADVVDAAGLGDAAADANPFVGVDPFSLSAREVADRMGFALVLQYAPWVLSDNSWRPHAAENFNSLSNLGELSSITLKNGEDAPLYLDEVGWPITDVNDPQLYPSTRPLHTMRLHNNLWWTIVIPSWLLTRVSECDVNPACVLDQPDWCSNGGTVDCDIVGMYNPNVHESLREHTLRRQVFRPIEAARAGLGPGPNVQVDVVNEPIQTVFTNGENVLYDRLTGESDESYYGRIATDGSTVWSDVRPSDRLYFIELALHVAAAADSTARLFINEYDRQIEGVGAKSQALFRLAQMLLARGAPLHGLGLQFHLKDQSPPVGYDHLGVWNPAFETQVRDYMSSLASLGLVAAVTEFDVTMKASLADDPAVLRHHARATRNLLDACIDSHNCHTFVAWGAIEAESTATGDAPFARGLFRHDRSPLPAWWALEHGLQRAAVAGTILIEPEWLPETVGATINGGQALLTASADGYMFWTNGTLSVPISLPSTGHYLVDVWATGAPAAGQDPLFDLSIGAVTLTDRSVAPGPQRLTFAMDLVAGTTNLSLSFTNDFNVGAEDRNLFIDAIAIRPDGP